MPDEARFYPTSSNEIRESCNDGPAPIHRDFSCGSCGQPTNGRVITSLRREIDGATIWQCVCSCPKREPVIILERGGTVIQQLPEAREFQPGERWPSDLTQLFEEAAKAYTVGAYTASTMASRKVLMACACQEGDTDGKSFADYVTYITSHVLTFPKAKDSIDKIRTIGNEANHRLKFSSREEARRALSIVSYMLNTIYSLPTA